MSKFCINCIHHTIMGLGHYCTRRIVIDRCVSSVTGLNDPTIKGHYSFCEDERAKASTFFTKRCGPSGQFFEEGNSKILGIALANSEMSRRTNV